MKLPQRSKVGAIVDLFRSYNELLREQGFSVVLHRNLPHTWRKLIRMIESVPCPAQNSSVLRNLLLHESESLRGRPVRFGHHRVSHDFDNIHRVTVLGFQVGNLIPHAEANASFGWNSIRSSREDGDTGRNASNAGGCFRCFYNLLFLGPLEDAVIEDSAFDFRCSRNCDAEQEQERCN